jgi:hypothetical protein
MLHNYVLQKNLLTGVEFAVGGMCSRIEALRVVIIALEDIITPFLVEFFGY